MREPIPVAVLMCDAPMVLPEIAGRHAADVASTTEAMRQAARSVVAQTPDVVVLLSPHAERRLARWGVVDGESLHGNLGPRVKVELPIARHAMLSLEREALDSGLALGRTELTELDHGAMVPLRFLAEAGWHGETMLIAFPESPDHDDCRAMGEVIARTAAGRAERWGIVACGDLSHRLTPDAPFGYHPLAWRYDELATLAAERGDWVGLVRIDDGLRRSMVEDAVDSIEVAASAIGWKAAGHRVLSYQDPFGTGYLVAVLYEDSPPRR